MNWQRTLRKLQRELARNKAKSLALLGLCVLAGYMWAPIVMKAFRAEPGRSSGVQLNEVASRTSDIGAASSVQVGSASLASDWEALLTQIKEDPSLQPCSLPASVRDPFVQRALKPAMAEPAVTVQPEPAEVALPPRALLSPAELGLKLRSTLVASDGGRANINGVSYRRGDRIAIGHRGTLPDDLQQAGLELDFRLQEVAELFVVLERDGTTYRLELPMAEDSLEQRISIRPARR